MRKQKRLAILAAMPNLNGRIALVTGASQGIGRACAVELAKAGAHVALAARNAAKLNEVAAEVTPARAIRRTSEVLSVNFGAELGALSTPVRCHLAAPMI